SYTGLVPTTELDLDDMEDLPRDEVVELLVEDAAKGYDVVEARFGPDLMRKVERHVLLTIIDKLWVQHLTGMDELREGVGLQAYGQKDPLVVYKTEGYKLFDGLRANISHDVAHTVFRAQPVAAQQPLRTAVTDENGNVPAAPAENGAAAQPRKTRKIGPNDQCPCGSGKKFKHCHGAVGSAAGPGLKTLV
ncbi:MAG: SEC-C domain-containing protein, partial [Chloroflexia bacterium]|nr:SEC-C domain-containing protein [Chloroflexia bacterium]